MTMDVREYMNTIFCAFEASLSVAVLRVRDGFDYSSVIAAEQQLTHEVDADARKDHSDDEVRTYRINTVDYKRFYCKNNF